MEEVRVLRKTVVMLAGVTIALLLAVIVLAVGSVGPKSTGMKDAKEYFYEGRLSFLQELVVEQYHNKGEIPDDCYSEYKEALDRYASSPANEKYKAKYYEAVEKVNEFIPTFKMDGNGENIIGL